MPLTRYTIISWIDNPDGFGLVGVDDEIMAESQEEAAERIMATFDCRVYRVNVWPSPQYAQGGM